MLLFADPLAERPRGLLMRARPVSQEEAVALAAGVVSAAGSSSADGLARSW